ncbi:MAG: thiamine pyrophosphate-binding protein, partial [Planctomycetota bacterium]
MSQSESVSNRGPKAGPSKRSATVSGLSIGDYLIERLLDYGVRDIFGIPGDYVLAFYAMLEGSPINTVGCTREDCAGFAADAYARMNNIGAVCVTYGVGGFSLANSIAGAYAEKSPVVLISGSPGLRERYHNALLHHRVGKFRTQFDVFRCLCGATTQLHNPDTAFREIDRVLDGVVRKRRPGYLELPRDMVAVVPEGPHTPAVTEQKSDPDALAEALAEATRRLSKS